MGKLELVIESENISIYSPKFDGETATEFEKFMFINRDLSYPQLKRDFDAIISVIKKMTDDCGARENLLDWKEEILKPYRSVSPSPQKIGLLERCDYIVSGYRIRYLL